MANEEQEIAAIKAYDYGNTIVVKYFDSGDRADLHCPFCHWFGDLLIATSKIINGTQEFDCPECRTKLASVTSKLRGNA